MLYLKGAEHLGHGLMRESALYRTTGAVIIELIGWGFIPTNELENIAQLPVAAEERRARLELDSAKNVVKYLNLYGEYDLAQTYLRDLHYAGRILGEHDDQAADLDYTH